MTSPFRSDAEHVREQRRRVDEEAGALEEKHADLQRALALRGRARAWLKISLVATVVAVAGGYAIGYFDAACEDARALAACNQAAIGEAELEHIELLDCERRKRFTKADVAACRSELAAAMRQR